MKKNVFIYLGSTVLLLILTVLGLVNQSYKTLIIIKPKVEPIEANFNVQVDNLGGDNSIRGQIIEIVTEDQEKFPAKNSTNEYDYAQAEIKIINNSSQGQTLVNKTRFLSSKELLFRLTKEVFIPAHQSIKAVIRADKPGPDYEIGPDRFTIPGLSSALQSKIYGQSDAPMTGGVKNVGLIEQKDIDQAKKELQEKIYQKILDEFKKQINDPTNKVAFQTKILSENIDAKAGDKKSEFNLRMKIQAGGVAFKRDDLLNLAVVKLQEKIPAGQELWQTEDDSLIYRLKEYNLTQQRALMEIQFRGKTAISKNNEALSKDKFKNLSEDEIKEYLNGVSGIEASEIKFSPFFLKKASSSEKRIEIKIK